jgi:antirestriction protein ArdC
MVAVLEIEEKKMRQEKKNGGGDRIDIYARIIAALEEGVRPWVQPWSAGHLEGRITRPLRHNGDPYSGINVLLLWSESVSRGFQDSTWMTYRQAAELGAHVRKGETGSTVVYANSIRKTETTETGDEVERDIPFLKAYTVFNIEQIDDLTNDYRPKPVEQPKSSATADVFFSAPGAVIRHGGNKAFYAPWSDHIQMPPVETFRDVESYYATLAHEEIHYAVSWIMPHGRVWRL